MLSRYHRLTLGVAGLALAGCSQPAPPVDLGGFDHTLELGPLLATVPPRIETRFIDFGIDSSHVFQLDGWTGDDIHEDDGSTFTWNLGEEATLQFFVLEPRALELTLRLRAYRIDGPAQKVAFELNGRDVGLLPLRGGMRLYDFDLPAEAVVRGRNVLRLGNVYPEKIGPGPADLGPPGSAWDYIEIESGEPIGEPWVHGDVVILPAGSELGFYVEVDGATALALDQIVSSRRRGRLEVRSRTDGGAGPTEHELRASSQPVALDLGVAGPTVVELTLTALGAEGSVLRLHRPRLHSSAEVRSEPPATGLPTVPPPSPGPHGTRRPNVLVYLVDTLRADHLGCYGYPRGTSPEIDAFAADAVVFDNALAQSSWTRSSVTSLFTGRLPTSHGVQGRDDALSEEASTLAEAFRQAGYATAAFVTNRSAGDRFGLGQGFETFELLPKKGRAHALADEVNRAVFAWLDEPREAPFFLYLHTLDPHAPYEPAAAPEIRRPTVDAETLAALEEMRREIGIRSDVTAPGSLTWIHGLHRRLIPVEPAIVDDLVSLYDAEIAFNDRHFGRLLDHLKSRRLYDDTVIVFVSDHGEEFYDHEGWQHGQTLYQEQLRVPLVIRFPGGPAGARSSRLAQQIDLFPTLAEVAGLSLPEGVQGSSLWPPTGGVAGTDGGVGYSHLELDGYFGESLVKGRFKLLCTGALASDCRLFDLDEDPRELTDLAGERPVFTGYLHQWLRAVRRGPGPLEAVEWEEDEEVREQLRALGYL